MSAPYEHSLKTTAEAAIQNLACQQLQQIGECLLSLLAQALGPRPTPLPAPELASYLPRLTGRKYPNGFLIVYLDEQAGAAARPLFSLEPPSFKFNPATNGFATMMDVHFGENAAIREVQHRLQLRLQ